MNESSGDNGRGRDERSVLTADSASSASVEAVRGLLADSDLAVCLCSLECSVLEGNQAFAELVGVAPSALPGFSLIRAAESAGIDGFLHHIRRASSGEAQAFRFNGHRADTGERFSALAVALAVREAGAVRGIACLLAPRAHSDVSLRDKTFRQHALEHLGQAVLLLDAEGNVQWTNRAYARITGFSREGSLGRQPACLNIEELLRRGRRARADGEAWQGEVAGAHADGTALHLLVSLSALDEGDIRWLVSFSNISGLRSYTKRLEWMARHDPLTRLPNRDAFKEHLLNAVYRCRRSAQRLAALFIDLDGFKIVNDVAGHEVGDLVLQQLARRLDRVALDQGAELFRLSGDEFGALLGPTDDPRPRAIELCNALLESLADELIVRGQPFRLQASIGVCIGPASPTATVGEILRGADAAMYRVKEQGGGAFCLEAPFETGGNRFAALQVDFDAAIREGRVLAYFQPIVELQTGRIVAIEARARWNVRGQGLLGARDALELAHSAGREVGLDFFVLERALRAVKALAAWQADGIRVAVNFSSRSCADPGFLRRCEALLAAAQTDPRRLRFEFPVGILSARPHANTGLLERLSTLGIEIGLDHVASSVGLADAVSQHPVEVIKLEEQLVDEAPSAPQPTERILSLCRDAARLGLHVGAEGIGRLNQWEFLRAAGCHEGQGTLVGAPQLLEKMRKLVTRGRCW